jgi:hypothetical protein
MQSPRMLRLTDAAQRETTPDGRERRRPFPMMPPHHLIKALAAIYRRFQDGELTHPFANGLGDLTGYSDVAQTKNPAG